MEPEPGTQSVPSFHSELFDLSTCCYFALLHQFLTLTLMISIASLLFHDIIRT